MKLSMSMIQWFLRDYKPEAHIQNDSPTIRGIRILSVNISQFPQDIVFVGNAANFISDCRFENAFIIVNQSNYLLFFNSNLEDLMNGLLAALEFFDNWERRMLSASSSGLSLQQMLDLSREVLGNPITVIDLEGNVIAVSASDMPENDPYWTYKITEGREHPAVLQEPWFTPDGRPFHGLSSRPQIVRNLHEGRPPLIMMYLLQDEEPVAVWYVILLHQEYYDLILQMTDIINKYLVLSEEFFKRSAQLRSTEGLLQDFLEQRMKNDEKGTKASEKLKRLLGNDSWRLALLCNTSRNDFFYYKSTLRTLKQEVKVPCCLYNEQVQFLIPESRQTEILRFCSRQLLSGGVCLALSMLSSDFFNLPMNHDQAVFTARQAENAPGIFRCEQFVFPYIREQLAQIVSAAGLHHPAFRILEDYDRINHTDLRQTLSVFLRRKCDVLKTSEEMHVHRNTIKYRISRIQEITGCSFEDSEEYRYLCISDWIC